jgi:hypothetical protein
MLELHRKSDRVRVAFRKVDLKNQHARPRIGLLDSWLLRCNVLCLSDASSSELVMSDMNEDILRRINLPYFVLTMRPTNDSVIFDARIGRRKY